MRIVNAVCRHQHGLLASRRFRKTRKSISPTDLYFSEVSDLFHKKITVTFAKGARPIRCKLDHGCKLHHALFTMNPRRYRLAEIETATPKTKRCILSEQTGNLFHVFSKATCFVDLGTLATVSRNSKDFVALFASFLTSEIVPSHERHSPLL